MRSYDAFLVLRNRNHACYKKGAQKFILLKTNFERVGARPSYRLGYSDQNLFVLWILRRSKNNCASSSANRSWKKRWVLGFWEQELFMCSRFLGTRTLYVFPVPRNTNTLCVPGSWEHEHFMYSRFLGTGTHMCFGFLETEMETGTPTCVLDSWKQETFMCSRFPGTGTVHVFSVPGSRTGNLHP